MGLSDCLYLFFIFLFYYPDNTAVSLQLSGSKKIALLKNKKGLITQWSHHSNPNYIIFVYQDNFPNHTKILRTSYR